MIKKLFSRKISILSIILIVFEQKHCFTEASIFDYIWPNRNAYSLLQDAGYQNIPSIPFEVSETTDRFISDASKLLGLRLSDIDFCQQRLILSLQKSCLTLTDDEISKLTISLMNCQNFAESKSTIECTPSMKLRDCTFQMSKETNELYSNLLSKTKSVCVSIRQGQFRGMVELTVNRLIDSSRQHLEMMDRLKTSQKQFEQATLDSIEEISDNQLKLMEKQSDLLKLANTQRIIVDSNLREIQKEKNFIRKGQVEIGGAIESLKLKIGESLREMTAQNNEAKQIFHYLFEDLEKLNKIAANISLRLESVSQTVFEKNKETSEQFQGTILKLREANELVQNFSKVLESIKGDAYMKLKILQDYLGDDENFVARLAIISIHIGYLLIAMICLVFMNADMVSRFMLLVILFGNLIAVLKEFLPLNLSMLTITLLSLLSAHSILKEFRNQNVWKWMKSFTKIFEYKKHQEYRNNDDVKYEAETNNNIELRSLNVPTTLRRSYGSTTTSSYDMYANSDVLRSRISLNRSRSTTPTYELSRCKATTRLGSQCMLSTVSENSDFCRIHERASKER